MNDQAAPAGLTDADILGRFQRTRTRAPSTETLGFRVLSVCQAEMTIEAEFEARAETMANPMKLIQGGFLAGMLDEAMSTACVMASGLTAAAPTLEMKVSFLRPARAGKMRAIGRVVRWGRTVAFTEGELYDAEDRLVAKASATALPTPFANYK
jgi:uncharacterized protein (TIGR00369 family)